MNSLDFQQLRLLCLMLMIGTCIHLQLLEHGATQWVLGEHALHCGLNDPLRMRLAQLAKSNRLHVTDVARMLVIDLVFFLITGHADFLRIDDDDVVTGIHVWRIFRLVLAAQTRCNLGRKTSQGLPIGVPVLEPDRVKEAVVVRVPEPEGVKVGVLVLDEV